MVSIRNTIGKGDNDGHLQLSGLSSASFYFGGFLSTKSGARKEQLRLVQDLKATLIFYESPNRLLKTLQDMLSIYGNRDMAVVREITKKFEEVKRIALKISFHIIRKQAPQKVRLSS